MHKNCPHGKESTKVWITQKIGKERGKSYQKMKRFSEERHTEMHGSIIEIFRRSQMSFSIRRVNVSEQTVKTAQHVFVCAICLEISSFLQKEFPLSFPIFFLCIKLC